MSDGGPSWQRRFSLLGFFLLVLGLLLLLDATGAVNLDSKYFWPIVLITVGAALLISRATRRHWW